jgi:hypothetical protein
MKIKSFNIGLKRTSCKNFENFIIAHTNSSHKTSQIFSRGIVTASNFVFLLFHNIDRTFTSRKEQYVLKDLNVNYSHR